jgi:hypothetical protein
MARIRFVARKGKQFQLTFDDYAVLDTVFQVFRNKPPKQLSAVNKDVQAFNSQQLEIFNGMMLNGITIIGQRDMFGYNTVEVEA